MQEAFFFSPTIPREHKVAGVIRKWLEASLDTPDKIPASLGPTKRQKQQQAGCDLFTYVFVLNLFKENIVPRDMIAFIPCIFSG